ncbi:MAG: 5'-nucleotidase C-terminal domain-containing protein [Candidatus Cloacimonetes bacterium]|nr:5'-nucleotidase C-terminal domain-containing protein [Candidatus Cloacimonadota bacterium]
MKKYILLILLILSLLKIFSAVPDTLYILHTTDIHGNLLPYDYYEDKEVPRGLAKIYTKVCEYRKKYKNVILLDSGDLIQGNALTYYYNRIDRINPHPMILAFNYMKYDAFAVGNHEIEQGFHTYMRTMKESNFPWLSANSVLPDGTTFFKPYHIIEKNGLKIGIVGASTPGIQIYLEPDLYPGMDWQDLVVTAKKYADELQPEVDLLIGLFHSGFDVNDGLEVNESLGLPVQNASELVATQVPEYDVILAGHTHNYLPKDKYTESSWKNKIHKPKEPIRVISGKWGRTMGVVQVIYHPKSHKIITMDSWQESMENVETSTAIYQLVKEYHQQVLKYIRMDIGSVQFDFHGKFSRIMDTQLVELINKAQMAFTGAEISFASCFNTAFNLSPGAIKVKDVYTMYPYENYLYKLEMMGKQIKDYLEFSASYFIYDGSKFAANPKKKGYNYDMAEGISYKIDVTKNMGNRIVNIRLISNGKLIENDKIYTVAINSYRALGGGGHMTAANAKNAKIISKSDVEMRNILIEYIKQIKTIPQSVDNNWKIIIRGNQ